MRVDSLYRCSNALLSIEWKRNNAYVSVFGQQERWVLHKNIDNGFRSDERGLYYGRAVDEDHDQPLYLGIGDSHYCLIPKHTPPAEITFNWKQR